MRPEIAILLLAALAVAGCDKRSPEAGQANAGAPVAASPDATATPAAGASAQPKAGVVDRSHAGEAAPTATFQDMSGATHTLADFRGKPVLVNLWATWCAPCIKEMPTLDTLSAAVAGKVTVLPISQDIQGAASVKPFFASHGYRNLTPYLDPATALSTAYAVNLPTTILYDANGKEVWRVSGDRDWSTPASRKLIAQAGA